MAYRTDKRAHEEDKEEGPSNKKFKPTNIDVSQSDFQIYNYNMNNAKEKAVVGHPHETCGKEAKDTHSESYFHSFYEEAGPSSQYARPPKTLPPYVVPQGLPMELLHASEKAYAELCQANTENEATNCMTTTNSSDKGFVPARIKMKNALKGEPNGQLPPRHPYTYSPLSLETQKDNTSGPPFFPLSPAKLVDFTTQSEQKAVSSSLFETQEGDTFEPGDREEEIQFFKTKT